MKKQKEPRGILIVGVGNILCSDEGIGVHIVRELEKMNLADNIELLDMGVDTFPLTSYLPGRRKVIIVDAVRAGGDIGSIYRLSVDEIERAKDKLLSLHQMGLGDILAFLQPEETPAEIVVVGVEPGEIKWGLKLSPGLTEKIPGIVAFILKEVSSKENQC